MKIISIEGSELKTIDESLGIYVESDWAIICVPYETKDQKDAALRITEIKKELFDSDYQAIKYAEGWYTETEYAPIKAHRQTLRDELNDLKQSYSPPSYTSNQLEDAKRLFIELDWQRRRKYCGDNINKFDPYSDAN